MHRCSPAPCPARIRSLGIHVALPRRPPSPPPQEAYRDALQRQIAQRNAASQPQSLHTPGAASQPQSFHTPGVEGGAPARRFGLERDPNISPAHTLPMAAAGRGKRVQIAWARAGKGRGRGRAPGAKDLFQSQLDLGMAPRSAESAQEAEKQAKKRKQQVRAGGPACASARRGPDSGGCGG